MNIAKVSGVWPIAAIDISPCPAELAEDALILDIAVWRAEDLLVSEARAIVHLIGPAPVELDIEAARGRLRAGLPFWHLDAAGASAQIARIADVPVVGCRDAETVRQGLAAIAAAGGRTFELALRSDDRWQGDSASTLQRSSPDGRIPGCIRMGFLQGERANVYVDPPAG